jgi:hypothetical protein
VIAAARQRARRALHRIGLTPAQIEAVGPRIREERRQLDAARALLEESRGQLRRALGVPAPDAASVLELTVQERLLARRERELVAALEASLASALRPDQALRLRGLPPAALGDVIARLSG